MCAAANDKYSHDECNHKYLVYKDSEHLKTGEEGSGILGSLGEFCGAFYHTPEVPDPKLNMVCLDPSSCPITGGSRGEPKTAVALVKYKIDENVFLKRYTNCYEKQAHAEDYFRYDITEGPLSRQISKKATVEITMYITMQPCHCSTLSSQGTSPIYSCCDILNELMEKLQQRIKICIKPTHLCKAGWSKKTKSKQLRQEIENAEEGLKDLMRSNPCITFAAMTEHDWNYLWKHVNVPADLQLKVGVEREALDKDIGGKLADWKKKTEKQPADVNQMVDGAISSLSNLKLSENVKVDKREKNI